MLYYAVYILHYIVRHLLSLLSVSYFNRGETNNLLTMGSDVPVAEG